MWALPRVLLVLHTPTMSDRAFRCVLTHRRCFPKASEAPTDGKHHRKIGTPRRSFLPPPELLSGEAIGKNSKRGTGSAASSATAMRFQELPPSKVPLTRMGVGSWFRTCLLVGRVLMKLIGWLLVART